MSNTTGPPAPAALAARPPAGRLEPLRPMPVDQVKAAMDLYQAGLEAILGEKDWQHFVNERTGEPQQFVKRSGWRKIGTWFGLDVELDPAKIKVDRDQAGAILRATVIARVVAPSGRKFEDVGVCDKGERRFSKPEHDIVSTAATRAINRATSDLVGMGEVSAEEVDGGADNFTPRWATRMPDDQAFAMADKLAAVVGHPRALALCNALERRYDGIPVIAGELTTALLSMLAPKRDASEPAATEPAAAGGAEQPPTTPQEP